MKRRRQTERKRPNGQRGNESLAPRRISHIVENRCPSVCLDVGPVVFIEAFSGAAAKATDPKSLLHAKVMLELLLIFHVDSGEDFRFPFDGFGAIFPVLG